MSPAKPSIQTPAERRSAEATSRTLVAKFAPAHVRLVAALRRSLRKRLPSAHEVVYEYRDCCVISVSPNEHGYEGVFAIRASANGVKLFLNQGRELSDPDQVMQGKGKQARFIDLESASTLKRPAVVRMIDAAIAHNPVPFARTGVGTVVVRSTSASRRNA